MSTQRREAMLEAVEGATGFGPLRDVVKAYIDNGISVQDAYRDLDQIRALLPQNEEDLVLDVMDLVAGDCLPEARIGRHQWGDPNNPIAKLDASGFEIEPPTERPRLSDSEGLARAEDGGNDPESTGDIAAVWDRLNKCFVGIYGDVLRNTATVRWDMAAFDNASHFLMAYAEFQRVGRDDDEGLVLNVSIVKRDDLVVWETDACQTRGADLVEGPTRSAPATEPLSSWIGEATDATIAWFKAETPNFIAYLNQEPTPYDVD